MNRMMIGAGVLLGGFAVGCEQTALDEPMVAAQSQELAKEVWHSSWNGANASAYVSHDYDWAYVDVWEDRSKGVNSAYLSYSIQRLDPESEVCEEICIPWYCDGGGDADAGMGSGMGSSGPMGPSDPTGEDGECPEGCSYTSCYFAEASYEYGWGEIPAGHFRAKGSSAHLATTVQPGSDFYVTRCESSAGNWTCSDGLEEEISIQIDWRADGMSRQSSNGTQSYTYGAYTYKSHGQWSSESAFARGHLGSLTLPGGPESGSIGQSKGGSIQKSILQGGEDGAEDAGVGMGMTPPGSAGSAAETPTLPAKSKQK